MKSINTLLALAICILLADSGLSHAQMLAETKAGAPYDALAKEICPLMDGLVIEKTKNRTDAAKPIGATLRPSDDGLGCSATAGPDGMHFGLDLIGGAMNLGTGLSYDLTELGRRIVFLKGQLKCKEKTLIFEDGAYIAARGKRIYGYGIAATK